MIAQWMLAAAALATLAGLLAACLHRFCPWFGIPRRSLWLTTMALSVLLPAALALRKRDVAAPTIATVSTQTAPARHGPLSPDDALLLMWAALSLAAGPGLFVAHRRTSMLVRKWPSRMLLGGDVTVAPDFGPATVGIFRAQVVLPAWALTLPADELRLVLMHERQHVQAHDQLVLVDGLAVTVLMPWNLALWWQWHRLRVAIELDCDARVTPRAADRPRYTRLLLAARDRQQTYRTSLALLPSRSVLGERLTALLESARPRHRQVAVRTASALACTVMATRIAVPAMRVRMVSDATALLQSGTQSGGPTIVPKYSQVIQPGDTVAKPNERPAIDQARYRAPATKARGAVAERPQFIADPRKSGSVTASDSVSSAGSNAVSEPSANVPSVSSSPPRRGGRGGMLFGPAVMRRVADDDTARTAPVSHLRLRPMLPDSGGN